MSNTDFDPNFVPDPANYFVASQRAAVGQVATSVDQNPDDAARAIELAKPLGLPSSVVHSDLDHYEASLKANVSSALVANNPYLRDYVNSHPLAAAVSNDDYGQLDKVSQVLKGLAPGQGYEGSILQAAVKGFKDNFDYENTDAEFGRYKDWLASNPLFGNFAIRQAAGAGGAALMLTNQLASGVIGGGAAGLAQLYKNLGGNEAMAGRLTRDLIIAAQVGMAEPMATPEGLLHPAARQAIDEAHEFAQAVGPYLHAGQVPPVGVHPLIDEVHVEQAKMDADALSEALKESAKSSTRERAPDMYANYIRGITDGEIGIAPDAVRALYGDKVPEPDDGILGFVPDLADKLSLAEATGADVKVPLADYLAKVEPDVAKELQDHIRARPEGLTVEEGKNLPGIEAYHGSPHEFEAFDQGKIGTGEGAQKYGYGHYVAENPEVAKSYSYDLNQLASRIKNPDLVPEGEDEPIRSNLYRVRVLRHPDEFLDWDKPPYDDQRLQAAYREASMDLSGTTDVADAYRQLATKLRSDKAASELLAKHDIAGIKYLDQGSRAGGEGSRNYVVFNDKDLEVTHRNGEARIIRQAAGLQGVRPEQVTLRRTSSVVDSQKGQYAFDILDSKGESIAHINLAEEDGGERLYVDDINVAQPYSEKGGANTLGPTIMRQALQQLKEQFPNAKSLEGMRVSGARGKAERDTGKEKTASELNAAIDLTKVRTPQPKQLELPQDATTHIEDREAFAKASAIGMTVDQYKRYQALIEKRTEEDRAAAESRAMADQRRRQTQEWRANRAELRPQVKSGIEARSDVELDRLLREGKLKLQREGLTDEQIAKLPREYIAADGVHPDDFMGLFGDGDGRVLVDRLAALNEQRAASGMKPEAFIQRMVDAETDRQMELRYGNLDRNILEEAKDQVLSETQENLLHEETLARAAEAGLVYSIGKEELRAAIKGFFDRGLVRDVSSDAALADAGRAGRATEMALLKGDYAEAFRQKQRQYNAVVMANLARKFEKESARFERLADKYKARTLPAVEQEYTNWVRDILMRVGKGVVKNLADHQGLIGQEAQGTLKDFVDYKERHDLREVPVAEFIQDPAFRRDYESLSVAEARDVHDAVRALDKNGRDEKKYIRAGDAVDLAELKSQLIESLQRFDLKEYDTEGKRVQSFARLRHVVRSAVVAHLQVETVFNRLDRFDPKGPWNQYIFRPMVEGANLEARLEREFSKKLGDIADNVNLKDEIPNSPFMNPDSPELPLRMTRKNLRAVLLNMGNNSNFTKLARGYLHQLEPDVEPGANRLTDFKAQIKQWVDTHATKEDRDWAQKVWDMLAELGDRSQTMYRTLTGIAPEKLPIEPIQTPHGTYRGGYYPLIRHPAFGTDVKLAKNDLEGQGYVRATTAAGYTKARTGAVYPLSLDLDGLPNVMRQIIHDTAMRPAIVEVGKVFYDNKIYNELRKRLGQEYADMFVPWLKDVANTQNYYPSKLSSEFTKFSDFMRQNAVTTLVGFNPSTVLKHTPTAVASSLAEVGPANLLRGVRALLTVNDETGTSNLKFMMQHSEEMQRRMRNWVETMGGGMQRLEGRTALRALQQGDYGAAALNMRDVMTQIASSPVALGDFISSAPTWMGKYMAEMEDHGVHGDAVFAADKAVRQAHGSSAITSKSAVARSKALSWFTGFFTFFNDLLNRQIETVWRAGEALDMAKEGQYGAAMDQGRVVAGRFLAYVVAPAMIEELVSPLPAGGKDNWTRTAAKSLLFTLSSSWVFAREIVNAMLNARDPSVGLISTMYKSLTDVHRDLSAVHVKPGNLVKHGTTLAGMLTGLAPAQLGRAAEFALSREKPKGPWGWLVGARYGTLKGHSSTFERFMRGK